MAFSNQVMRLTQGSSAMLSGQIAEGDLLTRIQNYKIPAYGYNLAEVCACESGGCMAADKRPHRIVKPLCFDKSTDACASLARSISFSPLPFFLALALRTCLVLSPCDTDS